MSHCTSGVAVAVSATTGAGRSSGSREPDSRATSPCLWASRATRPSRQPAPGRPPRLPGGSRPPVGPDASHRPPLPAGIRRISDRRCAPSLYPGTFRLPPPPRARRQAHAIRTAWRRDLLPTLRRFAESQRALPRARHRRRIRRGRPSRCPVRARRSARRSGARAGSRSVLPPAESRPAEARDSSRRRLRPGRSSRAGRTAPCRDRGGLRAGPSLLRTQSRCANSPVGRPNRRRSRRRWPSARLCHAERHDSARRRRRSCPRSPQARTTVSLRGPPAPRHGPSLRAGRRAPHLSPPSPMAGRHHPHALRSARAHRPARCPGPSPSMPHGPLSRSSRSGRRARATWLCLPPSAHPRHSSQMCPAHHPRRPPPMVVSPPPAPRSPALRRTRQAGPPRPRARSRPALPRQIHREPGR
jgi:hypothetical protein